MNRNERCSPPAVGGASLLIIFAVLCLTVFALLTLGTVQANCRLSNASINASMDYYAADVQAEKIFAQLRQGELPAEVTVDGSIYFYECDISDTQKLVVKLNKDTDHWTVISWRAVSTVEWDTDIF